MTRRAWSWTLGLVACSAVGGACGGTVTSLATDDGGRKPDVAATVARDAGASHDATLAVDTGRQEDATRPVDARHRHDGMRPRDGGRRHDASPRGDAGADVAPADASGIDVHLIEAGAPEA